MTRIPRSHPRYTSLVTRAHLAASSRTGLVVPEGLIAHGRGEAFDYLLGERTTPAARRAIRAASVWLANAEHPVLSVNGNVAALAAREVAVLTRRLPTLTVEVNLFHRTAGRVRAVARELRTAGVHPVRGIRPTIRIPGLPSDRGWADVRGIARADIVLVALEDGDRTEALRRWGRRVIAIDLNPLSRTARAADIPIVDELERALRRLAVELPAALRRRTPGRFPGFDARRALEEALQTIDEHLKRAARNQRRSARASPRPAPRTARPSGRRR